MISAAIKEITFSCRSATDVKRAISRCSGEGSASRIAMWSKEGGWGEERPWGRF